jgi:hypothetical protein
VEGERDAVVSNWSWRAAFGFVAHAPPRWDDALEAMKKNDSNDNLSLEQQTRL